MRIISGDLKGKKLLTPLDKSTRPLKDIVRESIFNMLDHSNKLSTKINKSKVQALFGIFLFVVGTTFIYRYLNL